MANEEGNADSIKLEGENENGNEQINNEEIDSAINPKAITPTNSSDEWDDDTPSIENVSIIDLLDPLSVSTELRRRFTHTVRHQGQQMKIRMAQVQRGAEDMDLEKLRNQVVNQVDKLEERLSSEHFISLGEKLTFSFAILNIFLIGFIVGAYPEKFHLLYTVESFILLPYRYFTYKRKNYHYFLADLCYFVHVLLLLFIWVFPQSVVLYLSCFAFTYGTLSWAVITWRNSLVLHSIDKTTSTFIHILPPTLCHVFTHRLKLDIKKKRFPGAVYQGSWEMTYTIFWVSVLYFIWQSAYHFFITHRRKEKIKAGRVTSFEYLRKSYGKTKIGHWVNSLPEKLAVVVFTGIQFSFQLATMMLCPLWFSSSLLSASFLTVVMFIACYNGATYYLEIFGKRFQKELVKLQQEVEAYRANDKENHGTSDEENTTITTNTDEK